ncbi:MAG: RNA 2',3'-cyclic phosphodiesterase [Nanoarchaeota archaeon]
MRCFIAIDLPEDVKEKLVNLQNHLKDLEDVKIKFVEKGNLHLTLKFLGEISDVEINRIKEKLKQLDFNKLRCEIGSVGVFPSPNYIRVVWISLEPLSTLRELAEKVNSLLDKKEDKFDSHITLGRVKFVKDRISFIKKLDGLKISKEEFVVNEIKLKKSTLTSNGPVYEDIFVVKLG